MSDAIRLQQNILKSLEQILPELLSEHVWTMSAMITGILRSRQVQFRKIAEKVAYTRRSLIFFEVK